MNCVSAKHFTRIKTEYEKDKKHRHICEDHLNIDIKNNAGRVGLQISPTGQGLVAGCCEQHDELSGYVQYTELLVQLTSTTF